MSEAEKPEPKRGALRVILTGIGAGGLAIAMATDALAVLGRHVGFGVHGSIEIFQMAAVVALSCAVLFACLDDRHASVDLLVSRLSDAGRHRLRLAGFLALAIAFAAVAAGSLWVSHDLWDTMENTDILAIPVRPFRLIWLAASCAATVHFVIAFVREARGPC